MNEKEIAAAVEKIVRSSLAEPQKEEHVCRCGSHKMTLEKAMDESLEQDGTSSGQAKMKRVVKNSGYYRLPKFFRAHLYFIYRYYIKLGFLDGPEGKIFHFLQAYWYRFLVDAKIYECEKKGITMKPQGDLKA